MKTEPDIYPDSETLQSLVQRFAASKWITGTNCINTEGYVLTYTELGRSHMTSLAEALRPFAPRLFGERFATPGKEDMSRLMGELARIGADLQPPALSDKEIWGLAGLAAVRYLSALGGEDGKK
jgi:hypothetical protein